MNLIEFFKLVLPSRGDVALAIGTGAKRNLVGDVEQLTLYALDLSAAGEEVYFSLAGYKEDSLKQYKGRKQENVLYLRCFWIDIDVRAEGNHYRTKKEAVAAVVAFCTKHTLPCPMIVDSGRGLHTYFLIDKNMAVEDWLPVATRLKALLSAEGIKYDPTRTADCASVLRPIETLNQKSGTKYPVVFKVAGDVVPFEYFAHLLDEATDSLPVEVVTPRKATVFNQDLQDLSVEVDTPKRMQQIIGGCRQMAHCLDNPEQISEPNWRAALSIAVHSVDPEKWITALSKGHPNYDPIETENKVYYLREQRVAPYKCTTFESNDPEYCKGCKHKGKITSPIVLGMSRPAVAKIEVPVTAAAPVAGFDDEPAAMQWVDVVQPPKPYKRTDRGIYKTVPGAPDEFITNLDLWVSDSHQVRGESKEEEKVFGATLHYRNLVGEVSKMQLDVNALQGPAYKGVISEKLGLFCPGDEEYKRVKHLLNHWLREDSNSGKADVAYKRMGWHNTDTGDEKQLLVGTTMYTKDGPRQVKISKQFIFDPFNFNPTGTRELFDKLIKFYCQPGLERQRLALLTMFGSIILAFGHDGAATTVLHSPKGSTTKSSIQKLIASIWGTTVRDHGLIVSGSGTPVHLKDVPSHFGCLPVCYEEIKQQTSGNHLKTEDIASFVYHLANGSGVQRRGSGMTIQQAANFNGISVISTNLDFLELAAIKSSGGAEVNRVLQINFGPIPDHIKLSANDVDQGLQSNYGVIGSVYGDWVARNQAYVTEQLLGHTEKLKVEWGATNDQRFRYRTLAADLVGGLFAKRLGLLPPEFGIADLIPVAKAVFEENQRATVEVVSTTESYMAEFLRSSQPYSAYREILKNGSTMTYEAVASEYWGKNVTREAPRVLYQFDEAAGDGVQPSQALIPCAAFKSFMAGKNQSASSVLEMLAKSNVLVVEGQARQFVRKMPSPTGSGVATRCYVLNLKNWRAINPPTPEASDGSKPE